MLFARLDRREVVADFGGGAMTSDAGALLLGATDRAVGLVERFAACFSDGRAEERVVRTALTKISALLSLLPNAPGLQYEAVC